jgi:hypothetical protein
MRLVDSFPTQPNHQEHAIRVLPIKLQMVNLPEVADDTRAALRAHLLNLPFSFASYETVRIHIPPKGLSLTYNVGGSGGYEADFVIDDVRDLPQPAAVWNYA